MAEEEAKKVADCAVAEATAAAFGDRPMTAKQRELLIKFKVSYATINRITSCRNASAIITRIMQVQESQAAMAKAAMKGK